MSERIEAALKIALECGGVDGAHHKQWVIDQMVRALTGCMGVNGVMGESPEYLAWVAKAQDGDDGPETYIWEEGLPP